MESIEKPKLINRKYRRLSKLGDGSIGDVYLAENIQNGRKVTIKIQKKLQDASMEESNQQFQNEIAFLSLQQHPFIIGFIESFQWIDAQHNFSPLCIVYELAEPQTLFDYIINAEMSISEEQALTWFAQICMALDYMHEGLHRNLKPGNILLVREEKGLVAKIADFGIIKDDEDGEENTAFIGARRFFPPERVTQQPYNQKADVWATGILLYFMITKCYPFPDIERKDYVKKLADCDLLCRKTISEPVQQLIESLLQKNHENRPGLKEVLQIPLVKNQTEIIKPIGQNTARDNP
ncbi:hypothetical protein FGO68_gene12751 [Halteria grandinella]|uniref:Protein kinase domain-containing protein n=1 Tax=Halteria grandinella TaxID=5974 RepID=A0A8J8NSY8_HALGN|nr:hypothetical protein FGO68_gene12751 [Halteria grandinella]